MMNVRELIGSRDQAQWRQTVTDWVTNIRIFVQENGEKALILGFALGAFIVLFFKIFVFISCLLVLAYLVIMVVADPPPSGTPPT